MAEVRKIQPHSCSTETSISSSVSIFQTNTSTYQMTRRISTGNQRQVSAKLPFCSVLLHPLPIWCALQPPCDPVQPQETVPVHSVSIATTLDGGRGAHVQTRSPGCSAGIASGIQFLSACTAKNLNVVSTVSTSWLIDCPPILCLYF